MTLNCRPGDLAVVVYTPQTQYLGWILRVLRPYDGVVFVEGGPAWWCEMCGEQWHAEDAHLRPIRDPGDDAVDESKAWLPPVPLPTINPELIPSKEKA